MVTSLQSSEQMDLVAAEQQERTRHSKEQNLKVRVLVIRLERKRCINNCFRFKKSTQLVAWPDPAYHGVSRGTGARSPRAQI